MKDSTPKTAILIAGGIQAILLLVLYVQIKNGLQVGQHLYWLIPAYTLAVLAPGIFMLLRGEFGTRSSLLHALAISGGVTLSGIWVGWESYLPGIEHYSWEEAVTVYILASLAVVFVAVPFFQARLANREKPFSYPMLFAYAWRNAMLLGNVLLFTGAFWLLLVLWGALFHAIRINLFGDVFSSGVFAWPATTLIVSFVISLGTHESKAMAIIRHYLLKLLAWLLPLAVSIELLFLLSTLFQGVQPLWETRNATALLLWLMGAILLFTNAAWQDGGHSPFRPWMQLLVRVALILLPVLSVLSIWALGLRVNQYGWTVERVWAALLVFMGAMYALGYAFAAVQRGWLPRLGRVNVTIALMLIATLFLAHTPLLDAQGVAASSIANRIISGQTKLEKFDMAYLRFNLGRAGNAELTRLAALTGVENADTIRAKAAEALQKKNRWGGPEKRHDYTAEEIAGKIQMWPKGSKLDPAFAAELADRINSGSHDFGYGMRLSENDLTLQVLAIDLNRDRKPEYVVVADGSYYPDVRLFEKQKSRWQHAGTIKFDNFSCGSKILKSLESKDYAAVAPAWQELRIGKAVGHLEAGGCGD